MNIVKPDYNRSVLSISSSIMKYYNVDSNYKSLKELDDILNKEYRNIVYLIIDGMGAHVLKNNMEKELSQYFAVLTDTRSVGVMGDERTYDYLIALRAVITDDFMTAKFAKIPYDILEKISQRIVNEVKHVNRVVYDITSKPPATIEWE